MKSNERSHFLTAGEETFILLCFIRFSYEGPTDHNVIYSRKNLIQFFEVKTSFLFTGQIGNRQGFVSCLNENFETSSSV